MPTSHHPPNCPRHLSVSSAQQTPTRFSRVSFAESVVVLFFTASGESVPSCSTTSHPVLTVSPVLRELLEDRAQGAAIECLLSE